MPTIAISLQVSNEGVFDGVGGVVMPGRETRPLERNMKSMERVTN